MVAGLVAGAVFGVAIQYAIMRMGAIGALYNWGEPSIAIGWFAHVVHSAIFGFVFGLITEQRPFHGWMRRGYPTAIAVGLGFTTILYVVNIGLIWPNWLTAVGFEGASTLPVPFFPVRPLLGHLLFGVILGTVFHVLVEY